MTSTRVLLATSSLVLAAACGDDGGSADADPSAPDARVSAKCLEARDHSDLDWIHTEIIVPGCASFQSCHMGTALEAGGLNLETKANVLTLVGRQSPLFPQFQDIVPFSPSTSYLMILLGKYTGPLDPEVGTMPYASPLLCDQKRDAIDRWILAGATDGAPAVDAALAQ